MSGRWGLIPPAGLRSIAMIETDPLTVVQIGANTADVALQAGPPGGLPEQVPNFVSELLSQISASTEGLGEAVSEITSGGESGVEAGAGQLPEQAGGK
jgi:hypothetical protein